MDNKGYSTTYETVRNGVNKIKKDIRYSKDKDFKAFMFNCLQKAEECC